MPDRKHEHIEFALASQTDKAEKDNRFIYEPLLSAHPEGLKPFQFLGKTLNTPIWASAMTGGTELSQKINENIARACNHFGMGMGLGSCRSILYNNDRFDDFNVRQYIGSGLPLFANLGIAQVDMLIGSKQTSLIDGLVDKLKADGLIVHVNPLQEFFQPEGDTISRPPVDIIEELLDFVSFPVIVKEVGQGMGYESLRRLVQLPVKAIEFGAFGGTNFSALELKRNQLSGAELFKPFSFVGHTAEEMIGYLNNIVKESAVSDKEIIISGGVKTFLDGFYLMKKLLLPSVYGQASAILQYASESYQALINYLSLQVKGLALANAFLTINQT
ncbi:MAG: type 2 isopentenyl-diphosphate Delta-isomerase [Bacteroidales bacterium]|nr:type 2 isopentenyl-diphosphate Delta-isomerase [Bacteroidales bacterium]